MKSMQTPMLASVLSALPIISFNLPFLGVVEFSRIFYAGVLFFLLLGVFWLIRSIVLGRLEMLSQKTETDVDDVIISAVSSIRGFTYTLIALYLTLKLFELPSVLDSVLTGVVLFVVVWQLIETVSCFIDYGARRFLEKDEDGDGVVDPNAATASSMVTLLARIVLWGFGIIFVLSNLGIEVTSLVAGLGIGGVAVAFALQGILSDLFSSFSLYFDKPFRIGDFIVVGSDSGTVEKIGIKTTRIRTLQGEELVVSNAELTSVRVQNFKRMKDRRISFKFGITYETPRKKVEAVIDLVKGIFPPIKNVRFDRVHFIELGDSALIYEVVYFVESSDYTEYMDTQQKINLGLMEVLEKEGIEFAYPTQTLYVKK